MLPDAFFQRLGGAFVRATHFISFRQSDTGELTMTYMVLSFCKGHACVSLWISCNRWSATRSASAALMMRVPCWRRLLPDAALDLTPSTSHACNHASRTPLPTCQQPHDTSSPAAARARSATPLCADNSSSSRGVSRVAHHDECMQAHTWADGPHAWCARARAHSAARTCHLLPPAVPRLPVSRACAPADGTARMCTTARACHRLRAAAACARSTSTGAPHRRAGRAGTGARFLAHRFQSCTTSAPRLPVLLGPCPQGDLVYVAGLAAAQARPGAPSRGRTHTPSLRAATRTANTLPARDPVTEGAPAAAAACRALGSCEW